MLPGRPPRSFWAGFWTPGPKPSNSRHIALFASRTYFSRHNLPLSFASRLGKNSLVNFAAWPSPSQERVACSVLFNMLSPVTPPTSTSHPPCAVLSSISAVSSPPYTAVPLISVSSCLSLPTSWVPAMLPVKAWVGSSSLTPPPTIGVSVSLPTSPLVWSPTSTLLAISPIVTSSFSAAFATCVPLPQSPRFTIAPASRSPTTPPPWAGKLGGLGHALGSPSVFSDSKPSINGTSRIVPSFATSLALIMS